MSSEHLSKHHGLSASARTLVALRSLRASLCSPLVTLLCAVIALLLLLLAHKSPIVVRELQMSPGSSELIPVAVSHPEPPEPQVAAPAAPGESDVTRTTSLAHTRADWEDLENSDVCKPLFDKLARNGFLCGLHEREGSCTKPDDWREYRARGVWMFSQFNQDAYVFIKHFTKLKRRGVYLDIASNDPIKLSNTYFMDRCLGWRGICVEANEMYYERTFRERSCQLVPTCAGSTPDETVRFRLRGEIGGVVGDTYKYGNGSQGTIVEKRCTTGQTVLDRNRISHVDFMSLDVEGHELQVLKGIDFSRTTIDVITIEVTPSFEEVQKLLLEKGYERHEVGEESEKSPKGRGFLGLDAIFVRGGVRFGFPE